MNVRMRGEYPTVMMRVVVKCHLEQHGIKTLLILELLPHLFHLACGNGGLFLSDERASGRDRAA